MCEPTTIALVVMAVAGATKAAGDAKVARAEQEQARYNAQVSLQAAYDERLRAAEDVTDVRRRRSIMTGRQRAAVGGSGISLESGSVQLMLDDTTMLAELDVLRIQANAERQAWGLEITAEQQLNQARIIGIGAGYATAGTLLSTAGSTLGAYNAGQR